MGRSLASMRVLVLVLVIAGGLAPRLAHAGGAELHAWATIRGTSSSPGCGVEVSVEVRADGEAVAGLAVEIALFDGGGEVLSTDSEVTGGDGVAWLSVDPGDTGDDWLDVNVADTYLGGTSILPRDGADCGAGTRTLEAETNAAVSSADTGSDDDSGGFPTHHQDHSLSCEYASIQIATAWFGDPIWEDEALAIVPSATDPHFGFRGDIDGPYGSSDDYGVYAEALVPVLNAYGYAGDVWYGADAGNLTAQLDAGHPTLVWVATRGDTGFYDEDANGNTFKLVPWEHVVVAYAYDDTGVFISDPGTGGLSHVSWNWFLGAWSVLDGMSLSVYPA